MTWWHGLLVGLPLGVALGVLLTCLCVMAAKADYPWER